jgi:CRISPR-associated protein (TIGR02710 family)
MRERLRRLGSARNAGRTSEDLVADLANNAWRRWREGKYDDAVARLYRLTEMLAQRELKERYDIKAANVKLDRLPAELHSKLEGYRSERDDKIKIGLAACYWLLAELESRVRPVDGQDDGVGSPPGLGAAFAASDRMPGLLEARNRSILAHGLEPVAQEVCEGFFREVMVLCRVAVPDLDARRRELQFPWMRDQPDPTPPSDGEAAGRTGAEGAL